MPAWRSRPAERGPRRGRPRPPVAPQGQPPAAHGGPHSRQARRPRQLPQLRPLHRRLLPGASCWVRPVPSQGVAPAPGSLGRRGPRYPPITSLASHRLRGRPGAFNFSPIAGQRPAALSGQGSFFDYFSITRQLPGAPGRAGPARIAKSESAARRDRARSLLMAGRCGDGTGVGSPDSHQPLRRRPTRRPSGVLVPRGPSPISALQRTVGRRPAPGGGYPDRQAESSPTEGRHHDRRLRPHPRGRGARGGVCRAAPHPRPPGRAPPSGSCA